MRVYVAAPWTRKEDARAAAELLEREGLEITEKWWDHSETTDPVELEDQAVKDVDGVERSDVLLLLNLEKSEGKAVETGIALGRRIPVLMVGEKSNVFHNLTGDIYQFPTVQAALGGLNLMRRAGNGF